MVKARYFNEPMKNKAMKLKLENGECLDVSNFSNNEDGDYILDEFYEDVDYCDTHEEQWIWSIGKHYKTGEIIASFSTKYYQNPEYECLFLR